MDTKYDIIVIGGGAAGLHAARLARRQGVKVCLIEKYRLGGVCRWDGCIPSKSLIKSASVAHALFESGAYGIAHRDRCPTDFSNVMANVRGVVKEVDARITPERLAAKGITVIFGTPSFVDDRTVEINGQKLHAAKYILCTGSRPMVPPVEGLPDVPHFTTKNIFEINALPQSMLVLGGGSIGVELAQSFRRLGASVSIVEMEDRILARHEDAAIASFLSGKLAAEGIALYTGRRAVRFSRKDGAVAAVIEEREKRRQEIFTQSVLVAAGTAPNTEGLGLEKAGVEFHRNGVIVNQYMQTSNERIFACGDVVGPLRFTNVAVYQAYLCVRNALFRKMSWQRADYTNIAWATFTEPEIAHLGLTEVEARARHRRVRVYHSNYADCDRSFTERAAEGIVKVITDEKKLILGAHVAGAQAGEIMQSFILARSLRLPLTELAQVFYIYPTYSELVQRIARQAVKDRPQEAPNRRIFRMLTKV